jgi:ubiquitin carboxyl-terminal hydrolase 5/13
MLIILDIPVILPPGDLLEFGENQLGRGLQSSEQELPKDAPGLPTDSPIN